LKAIFPANLTFQGGDRIIFLQIGIFSKVEETHVSLGRIQSILVSGAWNTLFSCDNGFGA
jgi:hypothetical protein